MKAILLYLIGSVVYQFWNGLVGGFEPTVGAMVGMMFAGIFYIAALILFILALKPQITISP